MWYDRRSFVPSFNWPLWFWFFTLRQQLFVYATGIFRAMKEWNLKTCTQLFHRFVHSVNLVDKSYWCVRKHILHLCIEFLWVWSFLRILQLANSIVDFTVKIEWLFSSNQLILWSLQRIHQVWIHSESWKTRRDWHFHPLLIEIWLSGWIKNRSFLCFRPILLISKTNNRSTIYFKHNNDIMKKYSPPFEHSKICSPLCEDNNSSKKKSPISFLVWKNNIGSHLSSHLSQ